jgi:hypothetical protein
MLIFVIECDIQNLDFLKFQGSGRSNRVAGVTGIHVMSSTHGFIAYQIGHKPLDVYKFCFEDWWYANRGGEIGSENSFARRYQDPLARNQGIGLIVSV